MWARRTATRSRSRCGLPPPHTLHRPSGAAFTRIATESSLSLAKARWYNHLPLKRGYRAAGARQERDAKIMQNRISLIALFASAAAFVGTPVFAQDADAFGQRFVEVLAASGVNLSYESATADGDTIVLSNFTVTVPDEDPVELPGDLTFTGVAEGPDGSFTAETATVGDIEFEEDGIAVVAANFLVEDITLPATYSAADLSSLFLYRHASAG